MKPLIVVVGPTGSGKTALAVQLAQTFNGELISCDAKQVYRGMDIGTNKEKELPVAQHLVDIKNPGEKVTVAEYQELAYQAIEEVSARRKLPILVGGSMLYAEAITHGYVFDEHGKSQAQLPRYTVLELAPKIDREILKERLKARTQEWLEVGLLGEVQKLLDEGASVSWLEHCGLEYRYFTRHLLEGLDLAEATRLTNISLNQYVKRQYTWWRRHPELVWVEDAREATAKVGAFLA